MADKIQIGLDDQTQAGAASIDAQLGKLEDSVESLEASLDKVGDEFAQADKAAGKLGDRGSDVKKLTLRLTEINQGLELLKKGAALVSGAINTLANEGNPAFVSLQRSAANVHAELLRIAESPEIQQFVTGLADRIETEFIPALQSAGKEAGPAMQSVADGFRSAQRWISNTNLALGVYVGEIDEAVAAQLRLTAESDAAAAASSKAAAEANRQARATADALKALGQIDAKLSGEQELKQAAQIENAAILLQMLDDERAAYVAISSGADKSGRTKEESLRKIELIQRRLNELPKVEAERRKAAADEIAKIEQQRRDAAIKAEEELQAQRLEIQRKAHEEAVKLEQEAAEKRLEITRNEILARVKMIEGADGGKLLENARKQIDPRAVAKQVADQRGAAAFDSFTKANQPDLAASFQERARFNQQRREAVKNAQAQGFRDVMTGRADSGEVGRAQTTLIQAGAQQAAARGNLDQQTAQALIQAANNQQKMAEELAAQAQALKSVNQALRAVGGSVQDTRANAQRRGLGR